MFSKLFPERLSSTWRLAILQGLLLFGSVAVCVLMSGHALRSDLNSIARSVVLDDLGEYALLYNRKGIGWLEQIFSAGRHEQDQALRITTPAGKVLMEEIPPAVAGYAWPLHPPRPLRIGATVLVTVDHPSRSEQVLLGCKALHDGNFLWFGRTDAEDRAYQENIRRRLWLAGLASAAFMLLPLWWFARQVLRPLNQMMVTVGSLSEGRADTPIVAPDAMPELRAYADAYNRGIARIKALTEELQSANDNLAHELRTPLARIRGNLEVWHDAADNAGAKDAAVRGLDEIDRATQLVQTILTVRAGEHHALKLHLEPVDLAALLGHLHELYQPAAEQRDLRLILEAMPKLVLPLDQQRITQSVANLLDNALAYTPPGGLVSLGLEVDDRRLRICVRDTGPGLRDDEIEGVWRRFSRGSAASARTPGMGLGLSLVRAIAIAHGGNAGCANRAGGGAEFWIELPGREQMVSLAN